MSVHAKSQDAGRSVCGKRLTPNWFTDTLADVTCGSCVRSFTPETRKRSWANKQSRLKDGYGDPSFRGTGVLKCALCGNPILEHPRWPCNLRVDVMR